MKRLAWLLLVVILSFNTVGFSLPASHPTPAAAILSAPPLAPPLFPAPAPAAASIPGYNVVCNNIGPLRLCASVSESRVLPGSFLTVYGLMRTRGEPIQGQVMQVVWHGHTSATCIGLTDEDGLASCTTYVPASMASGYKVYVKVLLDKYKILTSFRTKDITQDPQEDD